MSTTWNIPTTVRRVLTTTAAAGILLAAGTGCASARPGEPERDSYRGPVTSSMFAGKTASTCAWVGPSVFTLAGEYHCS